MKKKLIAGMIALAIGSSFMLPTVKVLAEEVEVKIPEYNAISKEGYVQFKDVNLKHAINKYLRRNLDGELTRRELSKMTELYLNFSDISDLDGIQYCTSLTTLELQGNKLTDITPLGSLKELRQLAININQIENIKPLENLTKLRDLSIHMNKIKDIKALTNMDNLSYLFMGNNMISDLTPLRGKWNLKAFYAENNQIEDISMLNRCQYLGGVNLDNNKISDLSPLSNLKELEYVSAVNQKITLKNVDANGKLVIKKPVGFFKDKGNFKDISNGGIANGINTAIIVNNVNDNNLQELKFSFEEEINLEIKDREYKNIPDEKCIFSGEVVQPITFNGNLHKIEDINKDKNIDIHDIAALGVKYNSTEKEEDWNDNFDLNKDGIVDIFDLVMISKEIK